MENIATTKPKPKRILGPAPSPSKKRSVQQDPRLPNQRNVMPLQSYDIDLLADITNGKCGLVTLMRQPAQNLEPSDDLSDVSLFVEVETTVSNLPKTIDEVVNEFKTGQTFDEFLEKLSIRKVEQAAVENATRSQSQTETWFVYRKNRITASKFKNAVIKVDNSGNVKNSDRCKTIISDVCSYRKKEIVSKAIGWGIDNEPVARKLYIRMNKSKHRKLVVAEAGFFIDTEHPFIGASPDGMVSCACHGEGLLEIKCPWALRDSKVIDFAQNKDTYLIQLDSGKVILDRNHLYYYQVQCQMKCSNRFWCDFFVCFSKDTFLERIVYDENFMKMCIIKASICYEKIIFPELINKKEQLEIENCVKELVSELLDKCEIAYINVDF